MPRQVRSGSRKAPRKEERKAGSPFGDPACLSGQLEPKPDAELRRPRGPSPRRYQELPALAVAGRICQVLAVGDVEDVQEKVEAESLGKPEGVTEGEIQTEAVRAIETVDDRPSLGVGLGPNRHGRVINPRDGPVIAIAVTVAVDTGLLIDRLPRGIAQDSAEGEPGHDVPIAAEAQDVPAVELGSTFIGLGLIVQPDSTILRVAELVISGVVIPREERYMERKFGAAYLDYKSRVRRWI